MSEKKNFELPPQFAVRPAEWGDLEMVVNLMNVYSIAQSGVTDATVGDVRREWQSPNFTLADNTRVVVDAGGQIVGYVEVWDNRTPPVSIWVWGCTHPAHEGLGIGRFLLNWGEERCKLAVERCPDGVKVVMIAGTFRGHAPSKNLFLRSGMTPARNYYEMDITFDGQPIEPTFPDGIMVRTYRHDADLTALTIAVNEAFKDHYGHVDQPIEEREKDIRHWVEKSDDHDDSLWFLAMDGEEIAGISICKLKSGSDPDKGHVNTLGVLRPWRRKGLGLALLQHSFCELHKRGQKGVQLGVDASSLTGATRLYENAGMSVARVEETYEKVIRAGRDLATKEVE